MEIAVKILVNPYFKAILSFILLFIVGKLVYLFITRRETRLSFYYSRCYKMGKKDFYRN